METLAIIVNYRSAAMTLQAVQSVLDSESIGPVRIVVVDNSKDEDEAGRLRLNLPPVVTVLVNAENLGFGRACNKAFDQFPGELVLLINPDARVLPGCLLRLQRTIASTHNIAAISPQIFWDEELSYFLPPSLPPLLFFLQHFLDAQGIGGSICIYRLLSVIWRWHSIKVWRTERPIEVKNLSGGLVLLKRESVEKAGGLFDPRFFLYFEDTDLFLRLRKAGYDLLIDPRARAVHYYDQCGREEWERKRAMMADSFRIFLTKHSNGWKSFIKRVVEHITSRAQMDGHHIPGPRFLSPFVLEVPPYLRERWLFEWSPNHTLIPSAGRLGKGPTMDFNEKYWDMLAPGQYFGRLGNPTLMGRYAHVVSWVVEK